MGEGELGEHSPPAAWSVFEAAAWTPDPVLVGEPALPGQMLAVDEGLHS